MDPEIASVYNHMLIPNQFHWPANVIADGAVLEPEPEPLPVPAPGANQLGPFGPDPVRTIFLESGSGSAQNPDHPPTLSFFWADSFKTYPKNII